MKRSTLLLLTALAVLIPLFLSAVALIHFSTPPAVAKDPPDHCTNCTTIFGCAGCEILPVGENNFENCAVPDCNTCIVTGPGC